MTVTTKPKAPSGTGTRWRRRGDTPDKAHGQGAHGQGAPTKADLQARLDRENQVREDRRQAVEDAISIIELPLTGLAGIQQRRLGPDEVGSLTLDIVALEGHKAPLADAFCDLADTYPVLGVVLDRLAKATPFGALFGVVTSLGVQIAENHRSLPAHLRGLSPNLVDRDELVDSLKAEAEARQGKNGDRQPVG